MENQTDKYSLNKLNNEYHSQKNCNKKKRLQN